VQTELVDIIPPTVESVGQISEQEVDIFFSEAMDSVAAGNANNYAIDNGVAVNNVSRINSSQYRLATSGFSTGENYTVTADTLLTDLIGNNLDANANSATFTAVVYADITFIVDDSAGEVYSGFYLKGSWDADGYYDASWGGGAEHSPFYDDGTHGDVTPNDHIYTVEMQLVVDDSVNTWEWGVNDAGHNWIAGNWQFWLPDSGPQTLTYEVPYGTSQAVTVTFQVDMSLANDVDSVFIAGSFNSWNPTAEKLTDPDGDDIFTTEHLFPQNSSFEQEYKYVKNGIEWEGFSGNRSLTIDDTSPTQVLAPVYFGYLDPTELSSVTFLDSTQSDYTNFANGEVVAFADSLFFRNRTSTCRFQWQFGFLG